MQELYFPLILPRIIDYILRIIEKTWRAGADRREKPKTSWLEFRDELGYSTFLLHRFEHI